MGGPGGGCEVEFGRIVRHTSSHDACDIQLGQIQTSGPRWAMVQTLRAAFENGGAIAMAAARALPTAIMPPFTGNGGAFSRAGQAYGQRRCRGERSRSVWPAVRAYGPYPRNAAEEEHAQTRASPRQRESATATRAAVWATQGWAVLRLSCPQAQRSARDHIVIAARQTQGPPCEGCRRNPGASTCRQTVGGGMLANDARSGGAAIDPETSFPHILYIHYTHTYSPSTPHTPHRSRICVATILVQCTRVRSFG